MELAPATKPNLTVVGIGASAGGLAALQTFLGQVPPDSGLSFVVAVHLSPTHKSHLAELLQQHSRIPVQQISKDTLLEPNHVYVIPPNANIDAIDTHLRLSKLEERRQERAPIDHFFRTLAAAHDGNGVAVILTGTGSDGTLGIRDMKAGGGLVIAQDPSSAEYDGMPQSAIATGMVDFILPVSEIPAAILKYERTQPQIRVPKDHEEVPPTERVLLQTIFAQLRARADRDFSRYKRSTVLRRIARRMQINYIKDLPKYVDKIREDPDEVRTLADDLLITVTHFFRDPQVFEELERDYIPKLFEDKGISDAIRVWCVGCATGEEAYSLAILLAEESSRREFSPQIQIFASDLHKGSLEKAREGSYPGHIETDVGAKRLKRFFQPGNGGFRVSKEIRDMIVFAPHNLLADPPFSRLDLICCRNLLIYLERDVQREVIELFHYALNPEGVLLLGSAESMDAPDLFRVTDKKLCFFRKRNVPAREPRFPVFPAHRRRLPGEDGAQPEHANEPIAYGRLHEQMVERYAPPSVLVGPDNKLVHLSEHAGRYLVHPAGEPTESILKLVREELRIELQVSIQSARDKKVATDSNPIPVQFNGHPRPVVMHVRPGRDAEQDGFVLIIFEEREPAPEGKADASRAPSAEAAERIQQLESQLSASHQRLQTIIEQYETSQEEMKASGEEMQSTNEELRSAMEELETSKEELQSTNEELETVNQQNRHRVEELAQLTSDLQNFLAATNIATLFLDRDLRILRFTPKLGELFNVLTTDRGRPISDLTHRLGEEDLRSDAQAVLDRLVPIEREVEDDKGCWYLARFLPYRGNDDRIEGVVITFIDIDSRRKAVDALSKNEERLRRMFNVDSVAVLILDESGTLIECNEAFEKLTGYGRQEIASRKLTWRNLTPSEYLEPSEQEWKKLREKGRIGPYEKEYLHKDGTRSWMILAGADLGDGTIAEYCMDISDRKKAEAQARAAEESLQVANAALLRANNDLKHFSYGISHDLQEPLRMIMSYAQLLARDYKDKLDEQANQYISYTVAGAKRMEALLTDMREYWSVDEQHVEDFAAIDCNVIFERAVALLETSVKESGAAVTRDFLPTVLADQYPLTLLFQNLIGNALKYRRPDMPAQVHVSCRRDGNVWEFAVADNGIGIDPEYLQVLFVPFRRLHAREYPGTGLGLAMCKKIVDRFGGRIWVESGPGQGATFFFTLPVAEGASPAVDRHEAVPKPARSVPIANAG